MTTEQEKATHTPGLDLDQVIDVTGRASIEIVRLREINTELLEAAEMFLGMFERGDLVVPKGVVWWTSGSEVERARAAIAKARGAS